MIEGRKNSVRKGDEAGFTRNWGQRERRRREKGLESFFYLGNLFILENLINQRTSDFFGPAKKNVKKDRGGRGGGTWLGWYV